MKQVKLYNVIFPIWLLLFFPPIIFLTLAGNFMIDSLVILLCFYMFKLNQIEINLKTFYSKTILKVWLFGFLADVIGTGILLLIGLLGDLLEFTNKVLSAIYYDPFSNPIAFIIVVFVMGVSGMFIFIFNYKITLKKLIIEEQLRFKIALTIAIITIPWTFLVPTKWFY